MSDPEEIILIPLSVCYLFYSLLLSHMNLRAFMSKVRLQTFQFQHLDELHISEATLRSQTEHFGNEDPSRKNACSDPLKVSDGPFCYCQQKSLLFCFILLNDPNRQQQKASWRTVKMLQRSTSTPTERFVSAARTETDEKLFTYQRP